MTGNNKVWRAPLAGLAAVAMLATMGVAASTAGAVEYVGDDITTTPTFTVTFDAGSRGKIADNSKQTLDVDSAKTASGSYTLANYVVDAPKVAVNSGYTFTGWYTAPTGGDRVKFGGWSTSASGADEGLSADAITKDETLYAHYAKTSDTTDLLTVTFGGSRPLYEAPKDSTTEVTSFKIAAGDKLADWQKPTDKVDGTIIDSWTNDLDAAITKDTSFAPKDTTLGVKVTFHVDSDYEFAPGETTQYEVKNGETLNANPVAATKSANAANAAKPGFRMVSAWRIGTEANAATYVPGTTTFTGNTDIYGLSDTEAYKVFFSVGDLNDGAPLSGTTNGTSTYAFANPDYTYVPAQSAITLPTPNLYDGLYQVAKWQYWSAKDGAYHVYDGQTTEFVKLSNQNITDPTNPSKNNHEVMLHATLEPAASQQYTVTFDENYGNGAQTKVQVAKGATVAVPATPVRAGYRFLGWYDASGNKFNFNTKINGNTTLYAHWQLTAQYDLNTLLAVNNKKDLYTDNSYADYESVRSGIAKNSEGSITGNGTDGYTANYKNDYLTDAKVTELTKTLQAAYAKLVYKTDVKNAFSDVNDLTPHVQDIRDLTAQGVIKGFNNGDGTYSFGGTKNILRQDFAAFLYRLAGEPEFDVKDATKTFSDVNSSTPHYKEIL
ncbi:InlB B-repeat-containing protein, partial [Bifidobacterium miconisargentati]|uniref:InlB B-repeat-containing protein n=1 Tax=Bifidobacterium miconisargentati TaxID=2834437 RepID=UPI001BDC6FD8